jgi:hypothetical protein
MDITNAVLPDKEIWKKEFINDKFYEKLNIFFKDQIKSPTIEFGYYECAHTPRYKVLMCDNNIQLDSFYYIDYIRKNSNGSIVDIGCGENFFSYFFDNIIGIDPTFPIKNYNYDFNKQFIIKNYQNFDNAIAINSLHFIRIERIKERILEFASVIKQNGYGYITFNLAKMTNKDETTPEKFKYIKEQIKLIDLNFIHIEYIEHYYEEMIDGNIRLLFRK